MEQGRAGFRGATVAAPGEQYVRSGQTYEFEIGINYVIYSMNALMGLTLPNSTQP